MFTNIHLERARKSQCAASRLSYVPDAIDLHNQNILANTKTLLSA